MKIGVEVVGFLPSTGGLTPPHPQTGFRPSAGMTKGRPECVRSGGRNDECGSRGMRALARPRNTIFVAARSCRLGPAHQGMKSRTLWFGTANWHGGFCQAPAPSPSGGQAPRTTFPRPHPSGFRHSAGDDEWGARIDCGRPRTSWTWWWVSRTSDNAGARARTLPQRGTSPRTTLTAGRPKTN